MYGTGTKRIAAAVALGVLLAGPLGCDKKTGGSGSVSVVPTAVEGVWAVTVTHSVTTNCGEATHDESWLMTLVQDGNSIIMTSDAGYSATGTIDGTRVTFTYSFPDGPGTTTSSVTLDFASLGGTSIMDIFSGGASYNYSDGSFACSGTDSWAGTRIPENPKGEGLTGAWNLTLTSVSTTCVIPPQETVTIPVTVVQVGDEVTISIPGLADFEGTIFDNDVDMSLFGEFDDGQFFVVAQGLLQIAEDGNSVSGPVDYSYFDLVEPSNDCTGVVTWSMERITAIP
jgi:hypothetical protein